MKIELPVTVEHELNELVSEGRYGSIAEAIADLVARRRELALDLALLEGELSGDGVAATSQDIRERARKALRGG
jgi:Arc/MetJ-type ribon-helix-helix transcriptional regulator